MKRSWYVLMFVAAAATATADLLPKEADLPKKLTDIDSNVSSTIKLKINKYVDQKRKDYNQDVTCPDENKVVGRLEFQSSAYTGDFDGGNLNDFMGMIIRGGLKIANGYKVCDGMSMRWLQFVKTSNEVFNGANKPATSFIDGDPLYPDFTLAGYTPLLFDAPGRGTGATAWTSLDWLAESALVCTDVANKKITYMGSFKWGFGISTAAGVSSVTGVYPNGWTNNISADFKTKFGADYAGWTLDRGCCICPVPEPSTWLALGAGIAVLARRRRVAKK